MSIDEQAIRDMMATWMKASKSGDVDTVLGLVSDDVVFLAPGRPPMRKDEFAAQSRAQAGPGGPQIDGDSDIQEIQVLGDWAFMWTKLSITVTPKGGIAIERSEGVNESCAAEQTVAASPIKAQSTAVARATASICNAEWRRCGGMSGREGFVHTFSGHTLTVLKKVGGRWVIARDANLLAVSSGQG